MGPGAPDSIGPRKVFVLFLAWGLGPRKVQALFLVVGPVGDVHPVLHLGPGGFCKWITSKALIGADFEVGVQLSCPPRSDPQTCGRLKVPLYTTIRPLALLSCRRWSYGSFMAMSGSISCPWSCMTWILLRTLMDTSLCESVETKSLGRFPIRTLSARLISSRGWLFHAWLGAWHRVTDVSFISQFHFRDGHTMTVGCSAGH